MDILRYKEFEGSAELDMLRGVCRGRLLFIDDVVTFEAKTPTRLQAEFEAAVDDYVATCAQIGKEPQRPCRGLFNVRVPPELHRAAARRATADETTLNTVVCLALEKYLADAGIVAVRPKVVQASGSGTMRRLEAQQNSGTREATANARKRFQIRAAKGAGRSTRGIALLQKAK